MRSNKLSVKLATSIVNVKDDEEIKGKMSSLSFESNTSTIKKNKSTTPTRNRNPSMFGILLSSPQHYSKSPKNNKNNSSKVTAADKETPTTDLKLQLTASTQFSTATTRTGGSEDISFSGGDDTDTATDTRDDEENDEKDEGHESAAAIVKIMEKDNPERAAQEVEEGESEEKNNSPPVAEVDVANVMEDVTEKSSPKTEEESDERTEEELEEEHDFPPITKVDVANITEESSPKLEEELAELTEEELEKENNSPPVAEVEVPQPQEREEKYEAKEQEIIEKESHDTVLDVDDKVNLQPQEQEEVKHKHPEREQKDDGELRPNGSAMEIDPALTDDSDAVTLKYDGSIEFEVSLESFEKKNEDDQVLYVLDTWMKQCPSNEEVAVGNNGATMTKESIALAKEFLFFQSNAPIAKNTRQQDLDQAPLLMDQSKEAAEAKHTFKPSSMNTTPQNTLKVVNSAMKKPPIPTKGRTTTSASKGIKTNSDPDQESWISDSILAGHKEQNEKEKSSFDYLAGMLDIESVTESIHSSTQELYDLAKISSGGAESSAEILKTLSVDSFKVARETLSMDSFKAVLRASSTGSSRQENGQQNALKKDSSCDNSTIASNGTGIMKAISFDSMKAAVLDFQDILCVDSHSVGSEIKEVVNTKQIENTLEEPTSTGKPPRPLTKLQHYKEALEKREKYLGESHAETLECLEIMARFHHQQGDLDEAERCYRDILKRLELTLTQSLKPRKLLMMMQQLANVLFDSYKSGNIKMHYCYLTEAQGLYTRSFLLCRAEFGNKHPYTLACQNNLATVHFELSNYALAEELYRSALKTYREVQKNEENNMAKDETKADSTKCTLNQDAMIDCIHNLANVLQIRSSPDLEASEELHREILTYSRMKYKEANKNTLLSVHNLAVNLLLQSQKFQKENKKRNKQTPTAASAEAEMQQNRRLIEAEELAREAYYGHIELLGVEHPDTMSSQINLANVLMTRATVDHTEDYLKEAETLNERVLEHRRAQLGHSHAQTVVAMHNLAKIYQTQRQYGKAEVLYRKALEAMQQTNYNHNGGEKHFHTMVCASKLSVVEILHNKDFNAATDLMNTAMKGYENYYKKEDRQQTETAPQLVATT